MKIISAGVIVHYDGFLLGCKPFGKSFVYDIPKGQVDGDETFIQTAIRELYEETGIKAKKSQLKDLGKFSYLPTKDLYLFSLYYDFNISKCKCISEFDYNGQSVPEIIGYGKLKLNEINFYYKSLRPILSKLIKEGLIW